MNTAERSYAYLAVQLVVRALFWAFVTFAVLGLVWLAWAALRILLGLMLGGI